MTEKCGLARGEPLCLASVQSSVRKKPVVVFCENGPQCGALGAHLRGRSRRQFEMLLDMMSMRFMDISVHGRPPKQKIDLVLGRR